MKKLLLVCILFLNSMQLFAATYPLKQGWNLVGINTDMTIETLIQKVGADNLLIVQGEDKTYQKIYVDDNKAFLNDFAGFERGNGYWVKMALSATLEYEDVNFASESTLDLKEGWNLVSALNGMDITTLIDKLGIDNLLVVQSADKTYQKAYADSDYDFLNDLSELNPQDGYWIKLGSATVINFTFGINNIAITNADQETRYSQALNGGLYDIVVYSDSLPDSAISQGSLAIFGNINGVSTGSSLKLNDTYPLNSNFIVKVFDTEGVEVAQSKEVEYLTSPIDFGNIEIIIETENVVEENYQGLKVEGVSLAYQDYGLPSLTDTEFNALSPENKRLIADKLLASMFYGMDKTELDQLIASNEFISEIKEKVNARNSDIVDVENEVNEGQYNYWLEDQQRIVARLYKLGLGREYINRWTAYVLTQTILFSPGRELDAVGYVDVTNVYNRLVRSLDKNNSIQFTTFMHVISSDNWKRFRSPEDNGREMLEIFLRDFDDDHVPISAKALQNWYLDRRENELVIGLNPNTEALPLFNTSITDGYSFYRELVKDEEFLPTVVARIVQYYFAQRDALTRQQIIDQIVASQPSTFQDIFKQIVFSKEFLLNTQRIKSFEESSLSTMKKMSYYDSINFYDWIDDYWSGMNQYPMRYKLGRSGIIPVDTLSFAYYHNFTRRYLLQYKSDAANEWQAGWTLDFISKDKIPESADINAFVDYIFESLISRKPTDNERSTINDYARNRDWADIQYYNDRKVVALLCLDYITRLSEFYEFQKIN